MPFLARGGNLKQVSLNCKCNLKLWPVPGKSDRIMKIALGISANRTQKATRPIYICVVYDRLHQNKVNTGIEVLPEQWDAARQKVVDHLAAKVYNANLSGQITELEFSSAKAQMATYHRLHDFYGELPFDRLDYSWLLDFGKAVLGIETQTRSCSSAPPAIKKEPPEQRCSGGSCQVKGAS